MNYDEDLSSCPSFARFHCLLDMLGAWLLWLVYGYSTAGFHFRPVGHWTLGFAAYYVQLGAFGSVWCWVLLLIELGFFFLGLLSV